MRQTFLIFTALLLGVSASAQKLPASRQAAKKILIPTPLASKGLSHLHSAGMSDLAYALEIGYLQAAEGQSSLALSTVSAQAVNKEPRSWVEQQTRNFKAWQLKKQRRARDQKILKEQQQLEELARKKEALPKLQPEKSFQAADFVAYTPEIKQSPRPMLPFVAEKGVAFRGLALATDGHALRNILQNGLRIQDSGEESNTLRMAYASHGGYSAMKPLIENPVINITCSPRSALYWGSKRLNADQRLLFVVKLRGDWDGDGLEVTTTDIPTSQFETTLVRLNIDGFLTWCKVELNPDGSFTLTPYERMYAQ